MRENPLGNDEKVLISFPAASCLLKFLIKFHFCLWFNNIIASFIKQTSFQDALELFFISFPLDCKSFQQ